MDAISSKNEVPSFRTLGSSSSAFPLAIELEENDVRANEFACKLIVKNELKIPIDILSINSRLGSGVVMQRSTDTSNLDLAQEYQRQKSDISSLLQASIINNSQEFRDKFVRQLIDSIKNGVSGRGTIERLIGMLTRSDSFQVGMRRRFDMMDLPILSASDARSTLNSLKNSVDISSIEFLLEAKIKVLEDIEQKDRKFFSA